MKQLSLWAKRNPAPAITLIIIAKIILAALSIMLGLAWYEQGQSVPAMVTYIAGAMLVLSVLAYPAKGKRRSMSMYYRQKGFDFMMGLAACLCMTFMANHPNSLPGLIGGTATQAFVIRPTAKEILQDLKEHPEKKLTRSEKKILKKEFKKQLGVYIKASIKGNKNESSNALLILLTIIAAVGLLYLVAALACELSCSGADGAAVAVALIGGIGVIWGAVVIIKKLSKKKSSNGASPATE